VAGSRFDKYDPFDGGFRARLNAALLSTDVGVIRAVCINTSGRVVIGSVGGGGLVDIRGLICPTEPMPVGAAIDVITDGEIAQATMTAGTAFTAGALVFAHADATGTVDATATAGKAVGFTVELNRLVVRCSTLLTAS
jgi:hypothetical protein